ncbi:MAG: protein-L-isoaspartate O-methyltransferase [Candidatus Zixiibacteriota bacterium]|nr:MAG: protein-L-isoaspartate O-methyltransferase [candidate division Zixibacteria bacterium]
MRMVDQQLARRDIRDNAVLAAMRAVPRHLFVPKKQRDEAYHDGPLSIGRGQTISQPYIVASMTEHLELTADSKVLEIGTGCGYQTAVLLEITEYVFSVERIESLFDNARKRLNKLGYSKVQMKLDDGSNGWPEEAPFDAIIVTAAAPHVPQTLVDQLADSGRMVIPVEKGTSGRQELIKLVKTSEGITERSLYEVRFVPLMGEIEK